jgi:hypothetical protein
VPILSAGQGETKWRPTQLPLADKIGTLKTIKGAARCFLHSFVTEASLKQHVWTR